VFEKQTKLFKKLNSHKQSVFGGSLLKNSHAKTKRPFRPHLALHVVLKMNPKICDESDPKIFTRKSLFVFMNEIDSVLLEQSRRHKIRVYGAANSGNHLHLVIQAPSKMHLNSFLRAFSGRVAQIVQGEKLEKSRKSFKEMFWEARPYSRLVSWGKDLKGLLRYIGINATETVLGISRETTQKMFAEIREGIKNGLFVTSPNLIASGFG